MLALELLISFILTYGIGLLPPLLIRYGLVRRPMERRYATVTAVLFGFFNAVIFTLIRGEVASFLPIILIGSATVGILTLERAEKKDLNISKPDTTNKSGDLERIYKITGNVSILLSIVGVVSGVLIGYNRGDFASDLIVAIIWNAPRFYFGLKLRVQNTTTVDTGLKISKGMFIYSVVVAMINLIPVIFSSFDNLMGGWLYYILIFLYLLSYRRSVEYMRKMILKSELTTEIHQYQKPKSTNKNYSRFLITLAVLGLLLFISLTQFDYIKPKISKLISSVNNDKCDFEISGVEERKDGGNPEQIAGMRKRYEAKRNEDNIFTKYFIAEMEREIWEQENYRWFHYSGLIRNNSSKEQRLMNINAKLRTHDNIFLDEGWTKSINQMLAPGEAVPFKLTIKIDSKDLVTKYVENKQYKLKTDFYPWFETCNY